jgi:hypothetical protein
LSSHVSSTGQAEVEQQDEGGVSSTGQAEAEQHNRMMEASLLQVRPSSRMNEAKQKDDALYLLDVEVLLHVCIAK